MSCCLKLPKRWRGEGGAHGAGTGLSCRRAGCVCACDAHLGDSGYFSTAPLMSCISAPN